MEIMKNSKHEILNSKQITNSNVLNFGVSKLFRI